MAVQLAILGFLRERNYHGYELKKVIEKRMGSWTDIKFGSIYHALGNLEKSGALRKVSTTKDGAKPARSIYAITDTGREEFKTLLRENILDFQRTYLKEDIGVFFGGKLDRDEFMEILRKRIGMLVELRDMLKKHSREIEKLVPDCFNVARWLVMHHVMHLEVEVKWFRKIREEFETGKLYQSGYSVAGEISSSNKS
ncbi:PadR family transcriptional regulator [bacterium]|nr:PadR family transcriptional regulator [bacterium]